jgi:hypothetical protein
MAMLDKHATQKTQLEKVQLKDVLEEIELDVP